MARACPLHRLPGNGIIPVTAQYLSSYEATGNALRAFQIACGLACQLLFYAAGAEHLAPAELKAKADAYVRALPCT